MAQSGDQLDLCGLQIGDDLRIVVAGDLDMATVPDLRAAVDELALKGMNVALDLDDLTFIDSSGLHELIRLKEAARAGGWRLELAGVRRRVRHVASLCGLDDALVFP